MKATGGALLTIVLATLSVRHLVLTPLTNLSKVVDQVQAGEDIGAIPAQLLKRGDEIGQLAVCFKNLFVAPLHHIEHVTRVGEQLAVALENMSQGLCMFDSSHKLVLRNRRFLEVYGLSEGAVPSGMPFWEFLEVCKAAGTHTEEELAAIEVGLARQLRTLEPMSYIEVLKNGRSIAVQRVPMEDGSWVTTFEDITERKQAEAQIEHMALHDALTGLSNRVFFRRQLEMALSKSSRRQQIGVFLLDLDRFKAVNDTLGHPVGDELLKAVAERLRSCVRHNTVVARLGGDEFAVIEEDLASTEAAESLASRIIDTVSRPYDVDGHNIVIGTSVGIALSPTDGMQADVLVKGADLALYRAKGGGRGMFRFFERGVDTQVQERRALELDLRRALTEGEFEVHYQPQVNLKTDKVTGFEALIRWRRPLQGLVPPMDFIPLAEEVGLIDQIGAWVLQEACRAATHWPDSIRVAVNLSPLQFRSSDLLDHVKSALQSSGLVPRRLELEITEAFLLQSNDLTLSTLKALRELGVRVSMDDFGTGYSSLGYLQNFVFDRIKIDQSFVRDLVSRRDSLAIVRAISNLGTTLGISTTAEGVETLGQLVRLRSEGCTEVQGYFISPPVPEAEIPRLLDGKARGHVSGARPQLAVVSSNLSSGSPS
jgi:diguanylate cyclase (GGDEF)-like protein